MTATVLVGARRRTRAREVRPAQRRAGGRRDLAGDAEDAQGVAAVGLDVDVEHDVAGQLGQLQAEGRRLGQDEDAVGVARETELVAAAEHALALGAGDGRDLDAPLPGQHRARAARPARAGRRGCSWRRRRWPARGHLAPTRTRVSDSRLEPGCGATSSSSPTTTRCQSAPIRSMALTSMPSRVSRSASRSGVSSTSTSSRSQESGTRIARAAPGSAGRWRGRRGCP